MNSLIILFILLLAFIICNISLSVHSLKLFQRSWVYGVSDPSNPNKQRQTIRKPQASMSSFQLYGGHSTGATYYTNFLSQFDTSLVVNPSKSFSMVEGIFRDTSGNIQTTLEDVIAIEYVTSYSGLVDFMIVSTKTTEMRVYKRIGTTGNDKFEYQDVGFAVPDSTARTACATQLGGTGYQTPSEFFDFDPNSPSSNSFVRDYAYVGGANGKLTLLNFYITGSYSSSFTIFSGASCSQAYLTTINNRARSWTPSYASPAIGTFKDTTGEVVSWAYYRKYIAIGYKDGQVEVWWQYYDTSNTFGTLQYIYQEEVTFPQPTYQYLSPAWIDIDWDTVLDGLLVADASGTWSYQHIYMSASESFCATKTCANGKFFLGCSCVACPPGTYRNTLITQSVSTVTGAQVCIACGTPGFICPIPVAGTPGLNGNIASDQGAEVRTAVSPGMCSYFIGTKAAYDYYTSTYNTEAAMTPGGASFGLVTRVSQGLMVSKELNGLMREFRNAQDTCGSLSLGSTNITFSGTRPLALEYAIDAKNIGRLPLNFTLTIPTYAYLVTIDPAAGSTRNGKITRNGQSDYIIPNYLGNTVSYKVVVETSLIPYDEIKAGGYVYFSISFSPYQYWSQVDSGVTERTDPVQSINVTLHLFEGSILVLPTENQLKLFSGEIASRYFSIYNLQRSQVLYDVTIDYGDDNVTNWLSIKQGNNNKGVLNTTCDAAPGDTSSIFSTLEVVVDTSAVMPGLYSAYVVVTTPGAEVKTRVDIEVSPGEMEKLIFGYDFQGEGNPTRKDTVFVYVSAYDKFGTETPLFPDDFDPYDFLFVANLTNINNGHSIPVELVFDGEDTWEGSVMFTSNGTYIAEVAVKSDADLDYNIDNIGVNGQHIKVDALACNSNSKPSADGSQCTCDAGYSTTPELFGLVTCTQCEPGTYQLDNSCVPCSPGLYAPDYGMTQCVPCPIKSQVPDESGKTCELCPAGYVVGARNPSSRLCELCPVGYIAPLNATSCTRCPSFAYEPSVDQTECTPCAKDWLVKDESTWKCYPCDTDRMAKNEKCVCRPEYYTDEKDKCAACPVGAYCAFRTKDKILPLQNYWQASWNKTQLYHCRAGQACPGINITSAGLYNDDERKAAEETYFKFQQVALGNTKNLTLSSPENCYACSKGYTGPLCFKCELGYTRSGQYGCSPCLNRNASLALLVIGAMVVICATIYLIYRTIRLSEKESDEIMILKILTSHLQTIAMCAGFPMAWTSYLTQLFYIYDLVSSAGQSIFSLDCLVDETQFVNSTVCNIAQEDVFGDVDGVFNPERLRAFFLTAVFYAILPIACVAGTGIFWYGAYKNHLKNDRRKGRSMFNYFVISNLIILFLLHPTLSRTGLKFFSCSTTLGPVSFLEADFNIICWKPEHLVWTFTVGIGMIIVYAVGIPASSFYFLKKHVGSLNSKYRAVYGFIFLGFKEKYYYWEVVIMLRKLSFAAISVILKPLGVDLQGFAALFVLVISLQLHSSIHPYKTEKINFAEYAALFTSFTTIFLGLIISSGNLRSEGAVDTFAAFVLIVNVAFLIFILKILYDVTGTYVNQQLQPVIQKLKLDQIGQSFRMSKRISRDSSADRASIDRGSGDRNSADESGKQIGESAHSAVIVGQGAMMPEIIPTVVARPHSSSPLVSGSRKSRPLPEVSAVRTVSFDMPNAKE